MNQSITCVCFKTILALRPLKDHSGGVMGRQIKGERCSSWGAWSEWKMVCHSAHLGLPDWAVWGVVKYPWGATFFTLAGRASSSLCPSQFQPLPSPARAPDKFKVSLKHPNQEQWPSLPWPERAWHLGIAGLGHTNSLSFALDMCQMSAWGQDRAQNGD